MEYLYSLGNILILISLSFRKVILIRIIFILSDLAFLGYGILAHLPQMIFWAIAPLIINTVQIIFLIRDMVPRELSKELRQIKKIFFDGMQTSEFLRIIKLSHAAIATNQALLIEDKPVTRLMLLTKGKVYINLSNTIVEVGNYHFIGEMSFFNEGRASITVTAREPVHYLYWNYDDLHRMSKNKPQLFTKIVEAMGKDIVLKMIENNKARTV